jgi:hypothetical protein
MIHLISTIEEARIDWLPQFVDHYTRLGVDEFHLSVHFEPDTPRERIAHSTARAEKLLKPFDKTLTAVLVCPYDAHATRSHHDELQSQIACQDDWILWADIDEFQVWPDEMRFLLKCAARRRVDYFRGEIIDRVSEDGSLTIFNPHTSIWSQYPRKCHITRDVANAPTQKVACSKVMIKITPGNHYAIDHLLLKCDVSLIEVHHFKWDASVVNRLKRRVLPDWRQRCHWWTESQALLEHIDTCGGRINTVSTPRSSSWGSALALRPEGPPEP